MPSRKVDLDKARKEAKTPYATSQTPHESAVAVKDVYEKTVRKPPIHQKKLKTVGR